MEIEVGCVVSYAVGKSGIVRFVGETDFAAGEWVGLELDKPEGKNNGELNGRVYFTCAPNHGLFCKKAQIKAVLSRPLGASATSASRLQQMRDRRASGVGTTTSTLDRRSSGVGTTTSSIDRRSSGVGTTSSSLRAPSSATTPVTRTASSGSFSRSASIAAPPGSTGSMPTGTTTKTASSTGSSSTASRLALDGSSARRSSISRAPSVPISSTASDEQLADAKARIAKLEEELEQKNRNVEQLKQSLAVMRDAIRAESEQQQQQEETSVEATASEETMDVDEESSVDTAAALEGEWLEKIESVRQEAEEHVRSVRAELEDHIAQLQIEHEEQADELRLENATQASEIKSLEAEIAQQKLRIAQFTTSEQKKAEEVALAVAKQSTGARKVETLEAQIAEFQEMIEMMTLEKETLEMDKEIAEERVEECLAEIEKLKASMVLAAAAPERLGGGEGTGPSDEELAEENRKLRAAVKALHERSSEEKAELNKKLRQHQREHTELIALREEVEQLTTKRNKLEVEVEELKELLDIANAYESMVEDLTEKNLSLGEKVADLEATVIGLESLKEMAEEMEHQHAEYEEELRAEIESQRASLQESKQSLADQKTVIDDRDRTIARFRDLTQTHREEINQLKAQLRTETGELESLKGTTHSALNQTMSLRTLAAAAREHEAEAGKQKINAEQARLENAFLRAIIPSSIFSEMDQKMLRVRLRLGRIAGKSDILVQYLRKDLEAILQQDAKDGGSGANLLDSARSIQQLLLGEKLAAVSCQAKEDLFMLECHVTTEEEFAQGCSQLDIPQIDVLEAALDSGLAAFADGTLLASRGGGDNTTTYDRLIATLDEWRSSRASMVTTTEGFPLRCAVVKLHARKSVLSLSFSLAVMITFARSVQIFLVGPENEARSELRSTLLPVVENVIEEMSVVMNVCQHFYRRAEIDLAPSDEDLDGVVAMGGDVVELIHAYAMESHSIWLLLQDQLSFSRLQEGDVAELVTFSQDSLLSLVTSLKDKIGSLFKSVCRGAFTDAVAPRSRENRDPSISLGEGRPQWQIRAQAIHSELLNASTLRVSLNEANEVCQTLQGRIRELERSDSQYRVVTQKLESEVLRLTESVSQNVNEKTQLEAQLTKEREQFDATLDESHKERAALDSLNRELRKQLKRSSDAGAASASHSSRSKTSTLSHGDAEAFRQAFAQLHSELRQVRATLAIERLDRVLGPSARRRERQLKSESIVSDRLLQSLKDVSTFSNQVKAQMSMPRLVDLNHPSEAAQSQLVATKLTQSKSLRKLVELRTKISATMQEDGWGNDVVRAIDRGENVFGWQPPEMERSPLLLSRVTLGAGGAKTSSVPSLPTISLLLNRSEVKQLTQALNLTPKAHPHTSKATTKFNSRGHGNSSVPKRVHGARQAHGTQTVRCVRMLSCTRAELTAVVCALENWSAACPWAIFPRKRLDVTYKDVAAGLQSCLRLRESQREEVEAKLTRHWDPTGHTMATLSIRTGFDLLLQTLKLPEGSEILCSAITIPDMLYLVRYHGLVAVPVDVHPDTLAVDMDAMKKSLTSKTRAILIAHIFGSRFSLDPVLNFAEANDLMVIEDCAQAFSGMTYTGERRADVSMFSFGSIKTATSFGGALIRVNNLTILEEMKRRERRYPSQTNVFFFKKLLKYGVFHGVTSPAVFGLFLHACHAVGANHDQVITSAIRGFSGGELVSLLQFRPSMALLGLLHHRLVHFDDPYIQLRKLKSEQLRDGIANIPNVHIPAHHAEEHVYWLFPVMVPSPQHVVNYMSKHGFDVTSGATQLAFVPSPLGPEHDPKNAKFLMTHLVYLPVTAEMPDWALKKMIQCFRTAVTSSRL